MASWWVVTYTASSGGALQLGTVIVQAASNGAARTAAAAQLPAGDQIGAARGPYPSQAAAASAGVKTSGGIGKGVNPLPGTGAPGTSPPSGGGQVAAGTASSPGSPCLISYPSANLLVTSVGGGCLLTKTNVRAMVGGLIIAAGGLVAIIGIALLVAEGFQKSGAQQGLTRIAGAMPGPSGTLIRTVRRDSGQQKGP
jgi:hypothetical protein